MARRPRNSNNSLLQTDGIHLMLYLLLCLLLVPYARDIRGTFETPTTRTRATKPLGTKTPLTLVLGGLQQSLGTWKTCGWPRVCPPAYSPLLATVPLPLLALPIPWPPAVLLCISTVNCFYLPHYHAPFRVPSTSMLIWCLPL